MAVTDNEDHPILTSPEQYSTRFHDGYTYSQRLDYLSSTVPSVQTSSFAAKPIENGYTAASPDHALPHIATNPNVWDIDDGGDREAVCAPAQKENQMATEAAEKEDQKPEPGQHPQWVGKQYIIGLRDGVSVHSHLASLPIMLRDQIEQVIPEINGYALPAPYNPSTSPLHHSILASIRKDPSVGFVVPKPRGFFSAEGGKELEGEELEEYKEERMWSTLQYLDPGVQVTDDGAE
ncbi:uncharacterized protein M437DRAFT_84683 [Aureobasidium melanogenum CBS 110374]|uniref:Uncharacterized protein n=1 Tax=Aureobasidium melanogenum (strain CBS 110374) TaxID=1043003 RepID=A0A074VNP1_AURM1|nr:uncharacterized protein M437DRAFT_84683 [Aureobasidium melanogenum CBS 110374]KEQ62340.1 hypothetical protein M437DRAFT_84683 [Aureobasidium melanogenum CBS 110374]